ncbi:helicase-exonuclease AddAB subunit AddA [Oenococcus kitaharae]|uniref:DNA 3'-5' helicase n=1 Tax=Oenococcus kitaharae DSM 17330 TaxID=1045004 RepID=G9WHY4_9LACO|nr:helicase-exonuclease AddAB subunit AddA [Oenococcus kitaharae]EHN58869.1 ATP-dependent nuclease subunit A [Oenococcus kitaharae DSM 17330]OEY81803.1 ATP-dependent helicase [Oenococcus kitaharae]OEY84034.1 ATP-dependent helicase [Oenococcus kitaharae]
MNYSENQKAVIFHAPDENLLVAASAGSGKTTVLIEHVYQQLLAGQDIDRFLISTFTDAAASEMKSRLEKRIRQGIGETSAKADKKHLQAQLLSLNSAAIGTLDAFSLKIIERYYAAIGLDPRYRILADQTEKDLLIQEVIDNTFNSSYKDSRFLELLANFSSASRDQDLKKLVIRLNSMAEARAEADEWLDSLGRHYRLGNSLTAGDFWQRLLAPQLSDKVVEAYYQIVSAKEKIEKLQDYGSYEPYLTDVAAMMQGLINSFKSNDWQQIRNYYDQHPWPKSARKKGNTPGEAEYFKQFVDKQIKAARDSYRSIATDFLLLNEKQWLLISQNADKIVTELVELTKLFRKHFAAKKRDLSLLDFSDGEQFAYQILKVPSIREEVQSSYHEVLVDEYQDINDLQESILTSVANSHNMFMVGDLKQSIYGFRQADPKKFTEKYRAYGRHQGGRLIELADNYRSEKNVTQFSNSVFDQLMDQKLGGIDYKGDVQLKAANKDYPADLKKVAEISIVIDDGQQTEADFGKTDAELELIAAKIQDLVGHEQLFDRDSKSMRPVQFKDITILGRSHAWENELQAVFAKHNIPVNVAAGNFLQEFEISVILSFLKIIDNPHQDIPLAAVLRSPIYGLDENKLAEIRTVDLKHDYFTAVKTYAETGADADLKDLLVNFLQQLNRYREIAADNRIVDLIWQIYDDTNWPEYVSAMVGGTQRLANLHALYEYAQQLSDNRFVGLFSFIRYVEQLMNATEDFSQAPADMGEQAVSVMTIHAAKGLEFPIVFLLNLDKKIDARDTQGVMVADFDEGVGIDLVDPVSRVKIPTLQKMVVAEKIKEKNWAEEMRLLYVALTRAEQRLYLIGASGSQTDLALSWETPVSKDPAVLAVQDRLRATSYQQWIGMALAKTGRIDLTDLVKQADQSDLVFSIKLVDYSQIIDMAAQETENDTAAVTASDIKSDPEINLSRAEKILDYRYPFQTESNLAAYHNVSELKRVFEDPDALLLPEMDDQPAAEITELPKPDFAQSSQGTHISSTDKGTATHLILEKIDWHKELTTDYLTNLIHQTISDSDLAQAIELDKLEWLIHSELGRQIQAHVDSLRREETFAMLLPAEKLYQGISSGDQVLVHGIIDGYFIDGDDVILFDYKTDRLTKNYMADLSARYAGQLNIYATALASMYPGKKVADRVIAGLEGEKLIHL